MSKRKKYLIVAPFSDDMNDLILALDSHGNEAVGATFLPEALAVLDDFCPDVIVTDLEVEETPAQEILEQLASYLEYAWHKKAVLAVMVGVDLRELVASRQAELAQLGDVKIVFRDAVFLRELLKLAEVVIPDEDE